MAEEENTKSLDDEIQGVIRTNQTLLRKKGLLKRLLEDSAIKNLLNHVLDSDKEKLLSDEEAKLLKYLSDNEFNLDKTIEEMVDVASKKMAGELINDKIMEDIETSSQPDEGPSQAEDDASISYLEKKPSKKLTEQQALELGVKGDKGNRFLSLGRLKIDIVVGDSYKILPEQGAQVRAEADIYSDKKKKLPAGQIVKVIESQEVVDAQVRLGAGARGRKIMRVKVEYDGGKVGWISTVSSAGVEIIGQVVSDDSDADRDDSDADADADAEAQAEAGAEADADVEAQAPAPAPAPAEPDAEELQNMQLAMGAVLGGGAE